MTSKRLTGHALNDCEWLCECGALPEEDVHHTLCTKTRMRQWHRDHKAAVIALTAETTEQKGN